MFYILAVVLGVLHSLAFSPTPIGVLQIIILTGLLAILRIARRPVLVMLAFGVAWFCSGLYWLHFSMHDIGGLPIALSAALVLLLALCLSGFYAVTIHFWARWRAGTKSEVLALCVAFPLCWLAAELARGYLFFGGFPWLASGYAQVDNVFLKGWFAVLGVYGVGLWAAFLAGALLSAILWALKKIELNFKLATLLGMNVAALLVAGLIMQGVSWGQNEGASFKVRIVQPNVAQNLKFEPEIMRQNTKKIMQQAASSTSALTVFPETVLPFAWSDLPDELLTPLQASLTNQRAVLMGGVGMDEKGFYNSAMWLDAKADMRNPTRYDKNHLLPMGERIPVAFKWLVDAMKIPLGGYQAGNGFKPFVLNNIRISANICYENEFGEELLKAWQNGDDNAPNVWVNMTNLGWFGTHDISSNQAQHLHMSRARAMEMARPMIVVTNTGTSANIDAMGVVLDTLPADVASSVEVQVQPRSGITPYIALGNAPLLALLSIVFGLMVVRRHRHVDI